MLLRFKDRFQNLLEWQNSWQGLIEIVLFLQTIYPSSYHFTGSVNLRTSCHLILNKFIMNIRKHTQPIYNMMIQFASFLLLSTRKVIIN
jgi:hypothetical protein